MFTGIVDHCGTIRTLHFSDNALRLEIACEFTDLAEGESIAVEGICLTALSPQKNIFACDVSAETLRLTTAKDFIVGQKVNLERALRVGDRLGGHWVTGHVDQKATVTSVVCHADYKEVEIGDIAPENQVYLLQKGSIAVDGVSLTVNRVTATGFSLMLIPHTLERTSLITLQPKTPVNLEFDWLSKVVCSQLKQLEISTK